MVGLSWHRGPDGQMLKDRYASIWLAQKLMTMAICLSPWANSGDTWVLLCTLLPIGFENRHIVVVIPKSTEYETNH